jgi:hypothetical protein
MHGPWHVVAWQLCKPWLLLAAGRGDWFKRLVCWLLWLSRHGSGIWPLYMQLLPREEEMCSLMNFTLEERCELQCPDMEALAEKVSTACRACALHLSCDAPLSVESSVTAIDKANLSDDSATLQPVCQHASHHGYLPGEKQCLLLNAVGMFA